MNSNKKIILAIIGLLSLCGCVSTYALSSTSEDIQLANLSSNDARFIQPEITYEIESVYESLNDNPGLIYQDYDGRDGVSWLASKTVEGKSSQKVIDYYVIKDQSGNVISKIPVMNSARVVAAQPTVMQYGGNVEAGAVFYPSTTTYGVDCYGCSYEEATGIGGTASSISVRKDGAVKQQNGIYKTGLKYGDYYVVAASSQLPLCTTLEISNHGYSGEGLTPGVPFKAIVLDRGGGVNGAHLDLFKGSERANNLSINRSVHSPKAEILTVGSFRKRGYCELP